jgi:hypothetical protein
VAGDALVVHHERGQIGRRELSRHVAVSCGEKTRAPRAAAGLQRKKTSEDGLVQWEAGVSLDR